MTNKRKIRILEKVIKRFEAVVREFDENDGYLGLDGDLGICDQINTILNLGIWDSYESDDIKEIFKIRMPFNGGGSYKWGFEVKDYKARIRACIKAIERLNK